MHSHMHNYLCPYLFETHFSSAIILAFPLQTANKTYISVNGRVVFIGLCEILKHKDVPSTQHYSARIYNYSATSLKENNF